MLARCSGFCFDGEVGVLRLLFVDRMKTLPCLLDVWIRKEYFCSTFFSQCAVFFTSREWVMRPFYLPNSVKQILTQICNCEISNTLFFALERPWTHLFFFFALWGNNWKYATVYIWIATWPPTQIPSGSRKPSWVFTWLLYWPIPWTSTG